MSRAALVLPLATLACATLLGTGAWLVRGEENPAGRPGAPPAEVPRAAPQGLRPAAFTPRTGYDPRNTDYGPPLGVLDPPAGHAGRAAVADDPTSVPVEN